MEGEKKAMGTNFYLVTRDKDLLKKYFMDQYGAWDFEEGRDQDGFGTGEYLVHLCKRSGGWKTLYQAHPLAWNSVKEMLKFIQDHASVVHLEDEYSDRISLKDYISDVVNWDREYARKPYKWGRYEFMGHTHYGIIPAESEAEAEIWTPFDHQEYARVERKHGGGQWNIPGEYFSDPEGYNFALHRFS